MSKEQTLTTQSTEERTERFLEVEDDLRAAREEAIDEGESRVEGTTEFDLRLGRVYSPDATTARVTGGQRNGDEFVLHAAVDGESHAFSIPYPDDPTDRTEPLVRLADWCGVDIDRIADIDRVPVVARSGGYRLHVPPGRRRRRVDVTLPGGRRTSMTHVSLSSRIGRLRYRLQRGLLRTSMFEPDTWGGMTPDYRYVGYSSVAFGTLMTVLLWTYATAESAGDLFVGSIAGGALTALMFAVMMGAFVSSLSESGETDTFN